MLLFVWCCLCVVVVPSVLFVVVALSVFARVVRHCWLLVVGLLCVVV